VDEGTEILAEQRIGDHAQCRLDHRRVHVELDLWHDIGGNPLDRIDHQVHDLVEVTPRERGVQRAAMGGPRVAFIGQQIDAGRGPDGFVVIGLDVFQPGPVQHVVDVVGVGYRDETSSSAAKPGDIVAASSAEEAVAGVESDGDRLA